MSEEAGFLQAICANPDDDTPRLVYADWLQEHGREERAEFIRVQCELERDFPTFRNSTPLKDAPHRLDVLLRRERELLEAPANPLDVGLWEWHSATVVELRRGFPYAVRCSWEIWRDNAEAILREHPVREVTLTTMPDWLGIFEHCDDGYKFMLEGRSYFIEKSKRGGYPSLVDLISVPWPGIKFTLPPAPSWRDYSAQYTNLTAAEILQRMQEMYDMPDIREVFAEPQN